jgi:acyl-[acyl-carrier-protein]-phospholipid O-acyltransferase / long-chain-fatty-acid--[acyl-carrier-protein] ligase
MLKKKLDQIFSPFQFLNISQFCSSINDNLYKYLLLYYLLDLQGLSKSPIILTLCSGIFIVPFLLFSINAGTLADRYSKRNIIVTMKVIELITVMLLFITFLVESGTLGYIGLFILGTEEAIIDPSKYGIVPELVPKEKISYSNGVLTAFSYIGIMAGTTLASAITEILHHNFVLASFALIIVAVCGLISALKIPVTPAAGSTKKVSLLLWKGVAQTLNEARKTPYLLHAMVGSALFMFLAAFSQGNIIPYAIYQQGLTDVQAGYLILITTVGVFIGAYFVGIISGPRVELGIVPFACYGFVLCFFSFLYSIGMLFTTLTEIFIIGLFGGIFLVPLTAYVQYYSRPEARGRFVAAGNFLCWLTVLLAACVFYLFRGILKLTPPQGFAVMGIIAFLGATYYLFRFAYPVFRFIAYLLSCLKIIRLQGAQFVPKKQAAQIFVPDLKSALCMISYRKRIILACADYSTLSTKRRRFYSVLGIKPLDDLQQLQDQGKAVCVIQKAPSPPSLNSFIGERCGNVLTLKKL